ncbi:hypothetical protein L227DRAFT_96446 [Lentinus tigrinus ALCF2SS1-6]|uniref:Uncharacterized protein n=1 Tax=Lentinus tigrinus ALCF2SS1-6 TaxID=1328759 RepID=A0A5C2SAS9_9APHY|nr:hypothetical protein L227DRAFT_96446 [Lentinus tigrinus ALCF2SS1-6]
MMFPLFARVAVTRLYISRMHTSVTMTSTATASYVQVVFRCAGDVHGTAPQTSYERILSSRRLPNHRPARRQATSPCPLPLPLTLRDAASLQIRNPRRTSSLSIIAIVHHASASSHGREATRRVWVPTRVGHEVTPIAQAMTSIGMFICGTTWAMARLGDLSLSLTVLPSTARWVSGCHGQLPMTATA